MPLNHNRPNLQVHFSSISEEWATPRTLFERLNAEFGFTLDACATPENAKCPRYFTKAQDGLSRTWDDAIVFMNPPYGRVIGLWVRKAYESARQGATVVCLIPARTDTAYWHRFVMKAEIRFLRGRVRFEGPAVSPKNMAPFPSAVVVFRPAQFRLISFKLHRDESSVQCSLL